MSDGGIVPPPATNTSTRGVEGVVEVAQQAVDVAGGERAGVADDHHPVLGHERRALGRVEHRGDRGLPAFGAPGGIGIVTGDGTGTPVPAAARPGMVISSSARVRSSAPSASATTSSTTRSRSIGSDPFTRKTGAVMRRPPPPASPHHAAHLDRTRDVVHPDDPAPVRDAVGDRRERRGAAGVDVEIEELAEEPLVRRRQQQRVPVGRERVALAQQHRALPRRLAEVEPGVERDLVGREPGGLGPAPPGRAGTR